MVRFRVRPRVGVRVKVKDRVRVRMVVRNVCGALYQYTVGVQVEIFPHKVRIGFLACLWIDFSGNPVCSTSKMWPELSDFLMDSHPQPYP